MNAFFISAVLPALVFVSDSIFSGLKILVPVVFLLRIFKIKLRQPDLGSLIISANYLLLVGGILFTITILSTAFRTWFYSDGFERSALVDTLSGPNGFQFILPVLNYVLLPNVMWIKKLRRNFNSSFVIVLIWIVSYFLVDYFTHTREYILSSSAHHAAIRLDQQLEKAAVFISLLFLFYFIVCKRSERLSR
jgi:hypothetical protein